MGAAWGLIHFVFEGTIVLAPVPLLLLWSTVVALTVVVGLLGSRSVLARTPLYAIRDTPYQVVNAGTCDLRQLATEAALEHVLSTWHNRQQLNDTLAKQLPNNSVAAIATACQHSTSRPWRAVCTPVR